MRLGTALFCVLLAVGWIALAAVSYEAVSQMGINQAGTFFFGDFAHPWRAQFNADFGLHLLLAAAWMFYRSRSWVIGLVSAVLAINLGGLFTLAYLIVVSIRAKGDFRKVLLGARAPAAA